MTEARRRVLDPWTGEVVGEVVLASAREADAAALRSVVAFEKTSKLPAYERRDALRKVSQSLAARAGEIAELIAKEAGKPITQAKGEVARAVTTFDLAAEESTRMNGEVMPLDVSPSGKDTVGYWVRVPVGPVLGIAPFNFPLNLVAHKVAPALACGASIVLKPPPQAPLTSVLLAAIVKESFPVPDALQVMPSDNDVAETLVRDDRFATLSFTGSTKVGWHLRSIAGKKRVLLELGGNAAVLVHEDYPVPDAAARVVKAAFAYAGQVCIKVQRLVVHRPIAERFVAEIVRLARETEPRSPLDPEALLGPMIDVANAERVEAWVNEAIQAGARPLTPFVRKGARVHPMVLAVDGDGAGLKVVDEEVFGPVLVVQTYETWQDALKLADRTRYGLQAGIFTDSNARIREAWGTLRVGGLIVNDVPTFRVDSMPYGGTRDSGIGREGVRFAMEEMTERKLLVMR